MIAGALPVALEKILRAELGRNHALADRDQLLLSVRIGELKHPRDELLRIAQRYQPLIGKYGVRYLESKFLALTRRYRRVRFHFELSYIVMRTRRCQLIGAAVDEGSHSHDVALGSDGTGAG